MGNLLFITNGVQVITALHNMYNYKHIVAFWVIRYSLVAEQKHFGVTCCLSLPLQNCNPGGHGTNKHCHENLKPYTQFYIPQKIPNLMGKELLESCNIGDKEEEGWIILL
jgi:hypothetical protein